MCVAVIGGPAAGHAEQAEARGFSHGMLSLGGLDNEIYYYRPFINSVLWANGFWKDPMKVADLW